jgi:hypothetical protein
MPIRGPDLMPIDTRVARGGPGVGRVGDRKGSLGGGSIPV